MIDASAYVAANIRVADISLDEPEVCPTILANQPAHLVKIARESGRKIIQPDNLLIKHQQGFQQVATDKALRTSGIDTPPSFCW